MCEYYYIADAIVVGVTVSVQSRLLWVCLNLVESRVCCDWFQVVGLVSSWVVHILGLDRVLLCFFRFVLFRVIRFMGMRLI